MIEDKHINVNSEVLKWARESIALSRNQVVNKISIPTNRLVQLETGKKKPTLEELRTFSKIYKRTIATLLLKSPPKENPLPKDRRTIESRQIGSFHEKTIMAVRKARALAHSFTELKKEFNLKFPKFSLSATIYDDPKEIAKRVSKILNLSIKAWTLMHFYLL